jgi:hypothetical protein
VPLSGGSSRLRASHRPHGVRCQALVLAGPERRIAVQDDTAKCANKCANACVSVDAAGFPGVAAVLGAMFRSMAAGRRAHCDAAHCQVEHPQPVTCPQSYRTPSAGPM